MTAVLEDAAQATDVLMHATAKDGTRYEVLLRGADADSTREIEEFLSHFEGETQTEIETFLSSHNAEGMEWGVRPEQILAHDVLLAFEASDGVEFDIVLRHASALDVNDVVGFLEGFEGSDQTEIETHLAHYGVKGMKWGVRNSRSSGGGGGEGSGKSTFSGSASKSAKAAAVVKSGAGKAASGVRTFTGRKIKGGLDASKMSDAELTSALRRLNMERQYKQLTGGDSGAKVANDFVTSIGKTAVKTAITTAATKLIATEIERRYGISVKAKALEAAQAAAMGLGKKK